MSAERFKIGGMSHSSSAFWVLFDTATKADYYGDVHAVLGLPSGALMRYDYRDRYIHESATPALAAAPRPTQVLVVYAQWQAYKRGDDAPEAATADGAMEWQALRFGVLTGVWRKGENNFLQFRLGGYPRADPALLESIIAPLHSEHATPYHRWVALSTDATALGGLRSADDAAEWASIVERLEAPPMQFQGDTFWRVDAPARSRWLSGSRLRSEYKPTGETPERLHQFVVPERVLFSMDVYSREPRHATGNPAAVAKLEVKTTPDGPLHPPLDSTLSLRRNAPVAVRIESRHSFDAKARIGELKLLASGALAQGGRDISLTFHVRLARWKLVIGALLGALAVAGIAACGIAVRNTSSSSGIIALVIVAIASALLGFVAYWLLTGRFKT